MAETPQAVSPGPLGRLLKERAKIAPHSPVPLLDTRGIRARRAKTGTGGVQGVAPLGQITRRPRCASTEVARVSWAILGSNQ